MKKLKEWQICLIKNWESYSRYTYKQIAEFCNAPSNEAVRSFWRRNKSLFEKETLNHKWDALVEEMDNYNDRIDGFEARVTNKPVEIVDTKHPHQGTHLVLGCVHIPFQNQKVLDGIYKLMEDVKFDGLHLLGDFLDLNTLSSHDKGRFTAVPNLTLNQEYAAGNKVLDNLDSLLPDGAIKTYLYGNHEDRWNRYMADMQAAKTPLESPKAALKLIERGYEVKTSWMSDYILLGDHLQLLHGIYFNQFCAKKHLDTLRKSCVHPHTHRIQSYIEGENSAHNIGYLGDVNSPAFNYASRPQKSMWQNGFAVITIDAEGYYYIEQVIVCRDRFVYGGKIYG